MKCRKCKSDILSPVIKSTHINGTQVQSQSCPVCGENIENSKKYLFLIAFIFIVVGVASQVLG
jgi:hypothetical protein